MFMDTPMQFEITMRLLFGKRAYHIASSHGYDAHRNQWLRKAMRKLQRMVDGLDTTARHKQMLLMEINEAGRHLHRATAPSWDVVYALFRLSMRLLGCDYLRGARCHTPFYWQTPEQYDTSIILDGGDVMQSHYDTTNAIEIRREIVNDLRNKGVNEFMISLVLNTSEYEVKQLRSNVLPKRIHRKRQTR